MATLLNKNLVRESTVKINDREINITLTADQEIKMKLKGMKSGEVSIPIRDVYCQLTDCEMPEAEPTNGGALAISRTNKSLGKDDLMISLYDLRSHNAISMLDTPTLAKFDQIIKSVIDASKL